MTAEEFLAAFAAEVGGTAPSEQEIADLLKVASIAAHGAERLAAPLACYIAGTSSCSSADALAAAQKILPGVE